MYGDRNLFSDEFGEEKVSRTDLLGPKYKSHVIIKHSTKAIIGTTIICQWPSVIVAVYQYFTSMVQFKVSNTIRT